MEAIRNALGIAEILPETVCTRIWHLKRFRLIPPTAAKDLSCPNCGATSGYHVGDVEEKWTGWSCWDPRCNRILDDRKPWQPPLAGTK